MPTIKDVAQRAGVTVTTVSRVINNRGYISEKTRNNVIEAMDALGYRPNAIALSLFRRCSMLMGIIIPTIAHPYYAMLTQHIEAYAYEKGYHILICNSQLEAGKEKDFVDLLRRSQMDGLILASHTLSVDEFLLARPFPVVCLDRKIAPDLPFVAPDNYQGAILATQHLIDNNCKKLLHVAGSAGLNMLSDLRSQGFVDTCKKHGVEHLVIAAPGEESLLTGDYTDFLTDILSKHPDIDGIFASSDMIAFNAVMLAKRLGIRIPEDLQIVGYDDISLATRSTPSITTIRQPLKNIAHILVDTLLAQVNNTPFECQNILPVTLIERETTLAGKLALSREEK